MGGTLFAAAIAILGLGLALTIYAIPIGLCLWIIGRLIGRWAMLGVALLLFSGLGWFGVTSHLGCTAEPMQCDAPGMILFAPVLYVLVPAWMLATVVLAFRVWRDTTR